jgi:hypothetical protein
LSSSFVWAVPGEMDSWAAARGNRTLNRCHVRGWAEIGMKLEPRMNPDKSGQSLEGIAPNGLLCAGALFTAGGLRECIVVMAIPYAG